MEANMLRDVLMNAPFGYACHKVLFDTEGQPQDYVFLDINPAFEEMTGLKRKDIIGKKATEVLPGIRDGSFDWVEFYGKITVNGEKQEFGQYFQPLGRWYKITVFSSDKEHFTTIFQEITQEMTKIQALKEMNSEIEKISHDQRLIFNSTQDAMFLASIVNGEIRYIINNAAHQEQTGYSAEEIRDKTPEEVLGQEMGQYLRERYKGAIEGRQPIQLEETLDLRKGTRTWNTIITPILEDGEVKYILGSRRDITLQKKAESEKEALFQRLQAMFSEHNALMLLIEPISGKIVDANPAAISYYGYTREELLNMYIQDINILPAKEVEKKRLLALKQMKGYYLFPHRKKNGEIRLVDVYSCPVTHDGEKLLYSIIFDVTDRERYKTELFKEKELLRTTLNSIGDGVATTDKGGIITSLNRASEEITGWSMKEAEGRPFAEVFKLLNEETGKETENPVAKVLTTGLVVGLANHTVLISKEGVPVPIADSAAPIKDEAGVTFGVVMVFRDVSTEKKQQEQILYLSQHDHLTGLLNRRSLENELEKLKYPHKLPLAIIMGDVNGLKLTNDVFGHEAGDLILLRMARTIRDSCRKGDIIVRWGGDEFLIILPHTNAVKAEQVIKRIKKNCALKSEGTLQLSISMGYSVKNKEEEDIQAVIREAEEMMYHKKLKEGKDHRTSIVRTMLNSLHERGIRTKEHTRLMKATCTELGKKLKCSAKDIKDLRRLAVLYDIGLTAIQENTLKKPESLRPEEWEEIKKHPEIGFRIAQNVHDISDLAEYILYHHERWDGEGYPQGLKGGEIPLLSRILAVADAYNAMTEDRPYRKAMSKAGALEELHKNAGTQFDKEIVNTMLQLQV